MAETSNTHSTQARIDRTNQTVVSGPRRTQLTPKAFAVLDFLRQHPGQLVTKDDLLSAVWPRVVVGDAVLKVAVGEIRKALEDDPQTPRFVQTVHRRGYRFIGALPEIEAVPAPMPQLPLAEPRLGASAFPGLIGRVREFTQLDEYWASALQGKRQIVFIGGEPGVGKTTLADAWLNALVADTPKLLHAKGGCLEQYGGSEAYLAVLDALGRLCRNAQSPRLKELLGQYAPSWLVQLPALLATDAEREELRQRLFGSTRERMLREMTEFLEALTTDTPLVLLLEDVHWADNATLDLLAFVARRNEPARLCIVATLRNTEVNDSAHPLKRLRQELIAHRQCRDLALDFFTTREVSDYLQQRLGHSDIPYGLAEILYLHTSGHPLFLASAVDYLLATGALTAHGERWALTAPPDAIALAMPGELRQILERQIAELNPFERRVLDAASVARDRFAAAALAVMLEADAIEVEDACERFARRGLWLARLETERWPDATVTESYRFGHALYRNYFYDTLPAARRQRFHLRLAERLEQAFGLQANTVAADLAYHFEQGGALERAVHFLQRAADLDSARFALREAARHLEHALLLLESGGAAQDALRAALRERRCQLLLSTGELPSAIGGYRQLAATARDQGDAAREVRALLGLGHALFWIDRDQCLAVAEQALECTTALPDALLKAHARGWRAHWQSLIRGYHPDHAGAYTDAVNAAHAAGDRRLECQHVALEAYRLSLCSRYHDARAAAERGLELARATGDGHHYLVCQFFRAWSLFYSGRWGDMLAVIADGLRMATDNGHRPWLAHFHLQRAFLQIETHAFDAARAVVDPLLTQVKASGIRGSEYFLGLILLARIHLGEQRLAECRACLDEIDACLVSHPQAIDWILRLPLHATASRYWQVRREWAAARHEAEALRDLAAGPMERTYYLLAQTTLIDIAGAAGETEQADAAIAAGEQALRAGDAPVAAWRFHASAARCHEQRKRHADAFGAWRASAEAVNALADALTSHPAARGAFLDHPDVQTVLRHAPA